MNEEENIPSLYKINSAQMRFVLWFQLISLFTIFGFIFLPFTIFYYLGWEQYNKEPERSFDNFLMNRDTSGISKEVQLMSFKKEARSLIKKLLWVLPIALIISALLELYT